MFGWTIAHIGQNIKTVEKTLLISKENAPIGQRQTLKKNRCMQICKEELQGVSFLLLRRWKVFFQGWVKGFFNSAYAIDISVACLQNPTNL